MSNPVTPAEYLELQASVSNLPAPPPQGYTRLSGVGSVEHYLEFLTSAIAPGYGPYPANSRLPIPVLAGAKLYFSDADYGAPPVVGSPPPPPSGPIKIPPPEPKPPAGTYVANDGTVLTVQRTGGQISELSGKGKDGHTYVLKVDVYEQAAPGRVAGTNESTLFARLSITQDGDTPLIFGFGYCPTDNLLNVFLERDTVSTAMLIDYSQSFLPNGTTAVTRSLTYYGDSYMSQVVKVPAGQASPEMYLAAGAALWPFLNRITFFGPAIEQIASETAAGLPKLPAPETPAVVVGSIAFGDYLPSTLSLASFVYNAEGTVGPALGPLAASVIDPGTPLGGTLGAAAEWLGWYVLINGEASLSATLTDDYNAWAAWVKEKRKTRPTHKPLLYPKDPKGHTITFHPNPWGIKPPNGAAGPDQPPAPVNPPSQPAPPPPES